MNTQQRVAAGVIGAVIGLAIGYIAQKLSTNSALVHFELWVTGWRYDAAAWMIGGVIVGVATTFLRR